VCITLYMHLRIHRKRSKRDAISRAEKPLRVMPWWGDRCRSTTATSRPDSGGRGSRVRPAPADDRGRPSGGDDATGVRTNLGVFSPGHSARFHQRRSRGRARTATLRGSAGSAGISPSTWPPGSAPGVSSDNGPMTDVGRATPCSAPSGRVVCAMTDKPGTARNSRPCSTPPALRRALVAITCTTSSPRPTRQRCACCVWFPRHDPTFRGGHNDLYRLTLAAGPGELVSPGAIGPTQAQAFQRVR
jgi:hypothetical protein